MRMLFVVSIALVLDASACAQQAADPYSTGMTLLSPDGCPVFVEGIVPNSPAERAGIRAGDRILAIDGTHVTNGSQAANSCVRRVARERLSGLMLSKTMETMLISRNGSKVVPSLGAANVLASEPSR